MKKVTSAMLHIDLRLHGDGSWPDLKDLRERGQVIDCSENESIGLAFLAGGMLSGAPSVMFRLPLPDGRVVLFQTSFALLETSVRAIQGRVAYLRDQVENHDV